MKPTPKQIAFLIIALTAIKIDVANSQNIDVLRAKIEQRLNRNDFQTATHSTGLIEITVSDGTKLYTNTEATGYIPSAIVTYLEKCAPTVHPTTMLRILRVESSGNPHAIGFLIRKGKAVYHLGQQPKSKDEAQAWATWLLQNGYRFDSGIAQVNSINFARTGLSVATAFEPCENLRAGSQILTDEYKRAVKQYGEGQKALFAAISAYQSGNFETGYKTGYVAKVTAPHNFPNFRIPAIQPPMRSVP